MRRRASGSFSPAVCDTSLSKRGIAQLQMLNNSQLYSLPADVDVLLTINEPTEKMLAGRLAVAVLSHQADLDSTVRRYARRMCYNDLHKDNLLRNCSFRFSASNNKHDQVVLIPTIGQLTSECSNEWHPRHDCFSWHRVAPATLPTSTSPRPAHQSALPRSLLSRILREIKN